MVRGAVALSLSLGSTDTSNPTGLDRFVRPSEPISRPFESTATEPVQQGLERSLALSTFRPLESRLTDPLSQGLAHNTGRTGVSPRRPSPELASEHSYWPESFATTLAKVDVTPRRTPCDERDVWPNGLSSGTPGFNGCTSLRSAFAELEDQRKQQHVLQQRLQQQHQAHLWPRLDSSSTPGTRVQAETPTSEQPSTPRGQLGGASRPLTSGYDDSIGTCTTIAVSGQPELSELVQAVHRLESKFAALRTEVTAEISCQVRSAAASAQLYQQQQTQQPQQPDTCRSAAEAQSTKLKVEALQRGATRAATAQYELEARVEALRMQLLPSDLEVWRRRVAELETRFQGLEQHGPGQQGSPGHHRAPGRQGRDASAPATNWRSADPPLDVEVSQDELQAATKIQAIARGNSERKRIKNKVSQHKIGKLEATVSSLQVALVAAEERFQDEASRCNDEIQHKLQLQLGEEFATFERRLKECEGRLLDEVSAASQAMTVAASSAAKVQDRVETLAAEVSADGGAAAALARRIDACEQQLPEVHSQLQSLNESMAAKMVELDSFKGQQRQLDGLEDNGSEVQSQLVELRRDLEQLVQSIIAVESRIPTEVDMDNEVDTHLQELNLPARAEFEVLQETIIELQKTMNELGLESLDGRLRCFEDRHEAAQAATEQEKAATKIQAIYRGKTERKKERKTVSFAEADDSGLELTKHKLPTSKKIKLLEKRLTAWEEQWPAEVEKATNVCLDKFAKQVPSKVEVQELVHTLLEHNLDGWENRLAQFDAARIEVEALMQRVDKHQAHLEELSVDDLKKLLESFAEGHNRNFEEARQERQDIIERIVALEVKLPNKTVDTIPAPTAEAVIWSCPSFDPKLFHQGTGDLKLLHQGTGEFGHDPLEAQHSLADRIEALCARLDGMYVQHAEAANAQQVLQRRVDLLQQACGAAGRQPAQQDLGASSDGEPDSQGKQLQKQSEAEEWQNAVRKDLALVQRRIFAELRAESQLWLTDQQWAIATLDERISLTDQRLSRRIDELVLALGRGRFQQQAQVAEAAALEGLASGTPEMGSQPLGDSSTLETTPPTLPPSVLARAPSPRRQFQVQFQESPGSEDAQAQLSAVHGDDKSEASTSE